MILTGCNVMIVTPGNEERTLETQLDGPMWVKGHQGVERSVKQDRQETLNRTQMLDVWINRVRVRSSNKCKNEIDQKKRVSANLEQPSLFTKTNTG